jgi:hypothetical protein
MEHDAKYVEVLITDQNNQKLYQDRIKGASRSRTGKRLIKGPKPQGWHPHPGVAFRDVPIAPIPPAES